MSDDQQHLGPNQHGDPQLSEAQQAEPDIVGETWIRLVQLAAGILVLVGTGVIVDRYAPQPNTAMQQEIAELHQHVQQLEQSQGMPASVLNEYRDSICYIYGVYNVGYANQAPKLRARVSGTGFIVGQGLVATNRHVAEPWYGDPEADALIHRGATPSLEKLIAFFPSSPTPVEIIPTVVSSKNDLAVLHLEFTAFTKKLKPLPLATKPTTPGDVVTVIGYPMGIAGMVAKSPSQVYDKLAYRHDDIGAANELAALSLIRPSATVGHLGDVVGDKLIYDAGTAHGGSGGPVFNSRGEVIGINSAFIDGFSGGTLGIAADSLRPLLVAAEHQVPQTDVSIGPATNAKQQVGVRAGGQAKTVESHGASPAPAHVLPQSAVGAQP
jgi:S1-C subfamily serine protease